MTYLVGIVAIIMSIVGPFLVLRGAGLTRKSATEATRQAKLAAEREDRFRHREETMRHLRWATELMLSEDVWRSYAGVSALDSLLESQLLQEVDRNLVRAMTMVAQQMEGLES